VAKRLLVTCSRNWRDWNRARGVLGMAYRLAPDILLVSGHARQGDQGLERIWYDLGGKIETHTPDWEGPCRPECLPWHRKIGRGGREYCPAAGDYRNHDMAELPRVVLCLAFQALCDKPGCPRTERIGPHYTHGTTDCANYAEYEVKIPTRRIQVPITPV
jgi:hypothetical protein